MEKEERIEYAVSLHRNGFNCSQAVFVAFSDLYGIERELALRLSAPFGGGIGRMRETCGAACAMFMLAGLENGPTVPKDLKGRAENYDLVQELAAEFKRRNGSICCGELLGLKKTAGETSVPPKRPCPKMVEEAARIFAEYLEKKNEIK